MLARAFLEVPHELALYSFAVVKALCLAESSGDTVSLGQSLSSGRFGSVATLFICGFGLVSICSFPEVWFLSLFIWICVIQLAFKPLLESLQP